MSLVSLLKKGKFDQEFRELCVSELKDTVSLYLTELGIPVENFSLTSDKVDTRTHPVSGYYLNSTSKVSRLREKNKARIKLEEVKRSGN